MYNYTKSYVSYQGILNGVNSEFRYLCDLS